MDELLTKYERELVILRSLCREYAQRYPKVAADLLASIAAISSAPCDILVSAHPDLAGLWAVIDQQGKGDRAKLVDSSACKRYAAGAKARLEKRLEQEKK